jgi:hypothetical protein
VKVYILRWGRRQEKAAAFARLDTLVAHWNDVVGHLPPERKNPLLRVHEKGAEKTGLSKEEIAYLKEAGLMKGPVRAKRLKEKRA